jgi:hypothetical protein
LYSVIGSIDGYSCTNTISQNYCHRLVTCTDSVTQRNSPHFIIAPKPQLPILSKKSHTTFSKISNSSHITSALILNPTNLE